MPFCHIAKRECDEIENKRLAVQQPDERGAEFTERLSRNGPKFSRNRVEGI